MYRIISISVLCLLFTILYWGCESEKDISVKPDINIAFKKCLEDNREYYGAHFKECIDIANKMDDPTELGNMYLNAASKKSTKLCGIFKESIVKKDFQDINNAADEVIFLADSALECHLNRESELSLWKIKEYAYNYKFDGENIYKPEAERETSNCLLQILLLSIVNQKESNEISSEKYPLCDYPVRDENIMCFATDIERYKYVNEQNRIISKRNDAIRRFVNNCCFRNNHNQKDQNKSDCLELIETYVHDPELKNELIYYIREETIDEKIGNIDIPVLK